MLFFVYCSVRRNLLPKSSIAEEVEGEKRYTSERKQWILRGKSENRITRLGLFVIINLRNGWCIE